MKIQKSSSPIPWTKYVLLSLLTILPILIYYPGVKGPFIFDDYSSFVSNPGTHLKQLSLASLQEAATSNISGVLGRPIAALSFALNYYFSGGLDNTYGFKLSNIIIHSLNGLLIFWFVHLCFSQLRKHSSHPFNKFTSDKSIFFVAGICALLWVSHPIQLTSVLYVVQRMASLAALFILLALISYIQARNAHISNQKLKSVIWLSTVPIWSLLAVFSKETGLLIPLYIILLEYILFSDAFPWNRWKTLDRKFRASLIFLLAFIVILLFVMVVNYALPGYQNRNFTLIERLLTESRVLIFYIGQTLIPRLSSFGLFHDDMPVSRTLWQPWTTIPAIILVASIFISSLIFRKRYPLLSLGILWFFVSHSIESTILPLELIHEHRNYLSSLGLIFVILQCIIWLFDKYTDKRIWALPLLFIIFFSATTAVRSHQWRNMYTLLEAQITNHPESPRAWADLARIQQQNNMMAEAISSITRAALLKKNEPTYLITLYLYMESVNIRQPDSLLEDIDKALLLNPDSTPLTQIFHSMTDCIDSTCAKIIPIMEHWTQLILKVSKSARYEYFLGNILAAKGKYDESLKHLYASIELANTHISPYLLIIDIYLMQGKINEAKKTYAELEALSMKKYGMVITEIMQIKDDISKAEIALSHTGIKENK